MTATIALPRQPHSDWLARIRTVGLGLGGRGVMGLGVGRSAVSSGAAGNGLLNALIAYWPGNEASGNLIDAHSNGLDLAQLSGTIAPDTGLVYATARHIVAADTEYFERVDEALLSAGDVDLTIAAWVSMDAVDALLGILNKDTATGSREWRIYYAAPPTSKFVFGAYHDGATENALQASTFGAPSAATWYLLVCWHDSTADTLNIQINNGAVDSKSHNAAGVFDGTSSFRVGRGTAGYYNGIIGPIAMWKSTTGGGGVLTADQRTALYNAGAGLAYANFTT